MTSKRIAGAFLLALSLLSVAVFLSPYPASAQYSRKCLNESFGLADLVRGVTRTEDVRDVQFFLKDIGYLADTKESDLIGHLGRETQSALRDFQKNEGAPAITGRVGPWTAARISDISCGRIKPQPAREVRATAPAQTVSTPRTASSPSAVRATETPAPATSGSRVTPAQVSSEMNRQSNYRLPAGTTLTIAPGAQPADSLAPKNAARVPFTKIVLTARDGDIWVNSVIVARVGSVPQSVFDSVVLLDENNRQIGSAKGFSSNNNTWAVVGDPFVVQRGVPKTLTIAGNMSSMLDTYAGQTVALSVVAVNSPATVEGVAPITGASHTINASLSLGSVTNSAAPLGSTGFANRGSTGYAFSGIRLTAGSAERVYLRSIRWNQSGSATASDLANVQAVVDGAAYPTTVSSDGRYYTAFFGSGILIDKGVSKDIYIKGNIVGTAVNGRTVKFDISRASDVHLVGETYGFGITLPPGSGTPSNSSSEFTAGIPWFDGVVVAIGQGPSMAFEVMAPEPNNSVRVGNVMNIAWRSTGLVYDTHRILVGNYLTDSERQLYDRVSAIDDLPSDRRSYAWTVPDLLTDFSRESGYAPEQVKNDFFFRIIAIKNDAAGGYVYSSTEDVPFSVQRGDASPLSAQLTANGATNITVSPGDVIHYRWGSTGGSRFVSNFSSDQASCGAGNTGGWSATDSASGERRDTVQDCQAGRLYTINYDVSNTSGETTRATVTVRVLSLTQSVPTATFTANGSQDITVNVGDSINYAWSSTGGKSYVSNVIADQTSCGGPANTGWFANGSASGQRTDVVGECQAGRTYVISYDVITGVQTAHAQVVVRVRAATESRPAAAFTANGADDITVNVGDQITYVWSSAAATGASSRWSSDQASCGAGSGGAWNANTTSGSRTDTVGECQAGRTYTITYVAANASVSAEKSVTVRVRPVVKFTANGSEVVSVAPGGSVTYTLTVLPAEASGRITNAYATYTRVQPDACGPTGETGQWIPPSINGSRTDAASSCQAGGGYRITYRYILDGRTEEKSVLVSIRSNSAFRNLGSRMLGSVYQGFNRVFGNGRLEN